MFWNPSNRIDNNQLLIELDTVCAWLEFCLLFSYRFVSDQNYFFFFIIIAWRSTDVNLFIRNVVPVHVFIVANDILFYILMRDFWLYLLLTNTKNANKYHKRWWQTGKINQCTNQSRKTQTVYQIYWRTDQNTWF